MQKSIKIFVGIVLTFSLSFMCLGYAALTDELAIEGSASVEAIVVIDYLHVSSARIVGGSSGDYVGQMSGSTDAANPMGWVILNLDFTKSLTKTVNLTITNSNPTLKYAFYQPQCVAAYSGTTATFGAAVNSGITCGTLNSQGLVVGGTTITSGNSISNISVTVTSSEAVTTTVILQMVFGFEGEADKEEAESQATIKNALEKLKEALNTPAMYNELVSEMKDNAILGIGGDYVGNVVGAQDSDTDLIKEIFGDTLKSVTFMEGQEGKECTVMIKKKNVTSKFSNPNDAHEFVLYLTTQTPSDYSRGTEISVYAVTFAYSSDSQQWIQHGDIYLGTAETNAYSGTIGSTSFNTETWIVKTTQNFTGKLIDGREYHYSVQYKAPSGSIFNRDPGFEIEDCISAYENAVG